jgi:ABC-type molybdate transport system permease subunit
MWRVRFPGQRLILALVISPMVVPVIIIAVGVYFAFAPLGLTDGYGGLILAHTTLAVPFVVVTVLATLSGFDRTLLRAAASLGARPLTTFRRVTLPLILPGVASGAVFAFAASFDEVVVALLIAGPGQRTLPRQMFAGINDNISLTITAAATMPIVSGVPGDAEYVRRNLRRGRVTRTPASPGHRERTNRGIARIRVGEAFEFGSLRDQSSSTHECAPGGAGKRTTDADSSPAGAGMSCIASSLARPASRVSRFGATPATTAAIWSRVRIPGVWRQSAPACE